MRHELLGEGGEGEGKGLGTPGDVERYPAAARGDAHPMFSTIILTFVTQHERLITPAMDLNRTFRVCGGPSDVATLINNIIGGLYLRGKMRWQGCVV